MSGGSVPTFSAITKPTPTVFILSFRRHASGVSGVISSGVDGGGSCCFFSSSSRFEDEVTEKGAKY
jgi:hypothetical protein